MSVMFVMIHSKILLEDVELSLMKLRIVFNTKEMVIVDFVNTDISPTLMDNVKK